MTSKIQFTETIEPRAGDLLIFVDETGDERFAGTQDYYGLGGCAVLANRYEYLKAKWRAVRQRINGDPASPLHGTSMERSSENFSVLRNFFLGPSFVRFTAVMTVNRRRAEEGQLAIVPAPADEQSAEVKAR
jgi:hypothetical protein